MIENITVLIYNGSSLIHFVPVLWKIFFSIQNLVFKLSPVTTRINSRLTKIPENSHNHQSIQEFCLVWFWYGIYGVLMMSSKIASKMAREKQVNGSVLVFLKNLEYQPFGYCWSVTVWLYNKLISVRLMKLSKYEVYKLLDWNHSCNVFICITVL